MDAVDTGQFFFDDLADQRIAVDGKDDFRIGDLFDDAAQGLIDVAHRFAQVFPAVRRQEDDPVVLEVDGFQVVAEVIVAGDGRHQGVDDGVPRHIDMRRVHVFLEQVGLGRRRRRKVDGRDGTGQLAVHFFRERRIDVPCPQTGFDVAYRDLLVIRSQGAGEGRRRIAVDQDQVRFFLGQDILQAHEGLCRNVVQRLPLGHDIQVIVRRNPEEIQDLVEHLAMLGCNGDDGLDLVGMFL